LTFIISGIGENGTLNQGAEGLQCMEMHKLKFALLYLRKRSERRKNGRSICHQPKKGTTLVYGTPLAG
jgi:hypothetical protein